MSHSDVTSLPAADPDLVDPELEALPPPRRPWRRLTLVIMAITAVASFALASSLWGLCVYALNSGPPRDLGNLTDVQLEPALANQWVRAEASLGSEAIQYRRPLDPDHFRLAPVEGSPRLWVQLRVPSGIDPARFVPPNSFVGRLVPLKSTGVRYGGLADVIATRARATERAWLLIDGEGPGTSHWAIGVVFVLIVFGIFNAWGAVHLLRPVRDV